MWPLHYLVQMTGRRGTANPEIWMCGIRLANREPDDTHPVIGFLEEDMAGDVVFCVVDWFRRTYSHISSSCVLTSVGVHLIGPDGKRVPGHSYPGILDPEIVGGSQDPVVPGFQTTVAITWKSDDRTRGLASRGRIYSPAPTVEVSPDSGLFRPDQAAEMARSAALMLEGLEYGRFSLTPHYPCIISDRGDGVRSVIDTVSVDNRIDIQRRRANRLKPFRSEYRLDHPV